MSGRKMSPAEGRLKIFAGIEGGSTRSTTVLVREDGQILSWVEGITTNYLLVGLQTCQETIKSMIDSAREKASIDEEDWYGLHAIGMGLSGCEDELANEHFVDQLLSRYPELSKYGTAVSDTIGSMFTACPDGGIVLISGTGSNSLLLNPNGSEERCGGWGHLIGDQGASYWIASRAIKSVIDHHENFHSTPFETSVVKDVVMEHFQIKNLIGLMPHLHNRFDKTHFAALAAKIAALADEEDNLAQSIFYDAGKFLAKHIIGLLPRVDQTLLDAPGGLRIVCVGSVWKSWRHLREGFFAGIAGKIREMTLVRLTVSSALGCAYLAAKKTGIELPIDFTQNYQVFCHFKIDTDC